MNWYLKVLKQYADFSGRARRKEFWMFALFNAIICLTLVLITAGIVVGTGNMTALIGGYIVYLCYGLAIFIPGLAVCVRRLHDIGKSGWFYFISLIPLVGAIILFVFLCQDSQAGANKWGANPKEERQNLTTTTKTTTITAPLLMNAHLQCRVGYDNFTYKIVKPRTTIGREYNNDLVLNHDTVSRRHAEIVFTGNGFEIIDLGSSNRVSVNRQFYERARLKNGDIIGLGQVMLAFYNM